nr:ribonucleotide reductase subunit 2 UL40 [Psittacid alphaherpesvirus 6]
MTSDYSALADALAEVVTRALMEKDVCTEKSPARVETKFRLSMIDGEMSVTTRCANEPMSPDKTDDDTDLQVTCHLNGETSQEINKNYTIRAWLNSLDGCRDIDSPTSPPLTKISNGIYSWSCNGDAGNGDLQHSDMDGSDPTIPNRAEEDDIDPEDYFYVTQCPDINQMRSLSMVNRWTETEFVVADDLNDVRKLSPEELNFLRFIFVFLSAADDLVNLNLGTLQGLFRQKDIQHYYVEQECIEAVHSRVYSQIQLMLFGNDALARAAYVRNVITDPAIVAKIRWLDSKVAECDSIAEKYVLLAIIEGIFFSSSFAAIAYLRCNNLFTVMCQLNTLISRDEAIHTTVSCIIYNRYLPHVPKPTSRRIYLLFKEAVKIECQFLRSKAPGINSKLIDLDAICSYVRYSADRILQLLGLQPMYDEPKPPTEFPMALMFTSDNTNFFERRSTAYAGCITNDL